MPSNIDIKYWYSILISKIVVQYRYQKLPSNINIKNWHTISISNIDIQHRYQILISKISTFFQDIVISRLVWKNLTCELLDSLYLWGWRGWMGGGLAVLNDTNFLYWKIFRETINDRRRLRGRQMQIIFQSNTFSVLRVHKRGKHPTTNSTRNHFEKHNKRLKGTVRIFFC